MRATPRRRWRVRSGESSTTTTFDPPRDGRARLAGGCDGGTTDTHADGLAIARAAAGLLASGAVAHVSGCEKGCARPDRADVVLTARNGRYDLGLDARAGGPAIRSGLTPAEAVAAVAALPICKGKERQRV